jgi:hypothetical protein
MSMIAAPAIMMIVEVSMDLLKISRYGKRGGPWSSEGVEL